MRHSVGQTAGIPLFSITPGKPDRGTLFDYGADFYHMAQGGASSYAGAGEECESVRVSGFRTAMIHPTAGTLAPTDPGQPKRLPGTKRRLVASNGSVNRSAFVGTNTACIRNHNTTADFEFTGGF
jgi:hypothetical protein